MSNVPPPNPFSVQPQPPANPYAAPGVQPTGNLNPNDPEAIRKYYIGHEASVKSIGTLYILGAGFLALLTVVYIVMFVAALTSNDPQEKALLPVAVIAGMVTGVMSVVQLVTSFGLWKLKPWARIAATVISVIGLLGFPLGTIISAYFLWLLQSEKGGVVFSPGYQEIIRQTPHVKYRTSIITWLVLALLVLFIIAMIGIATVGSAR